MLHPKLEITILVLLAKTYFYMSNTSGVLIIWGRIFSICKGVLIINKEEDNLKKSQKFRIQVKKLFFHFSNSNIINKMTE